MPSSHFVKPAVAEKHFGVTRRTLKKWVATGHIKCVRPGDVGPWLYDIGSVAHTDGSLAAAPVDSGSTAAAVGDGHQLEREDVVYARVSTRKQLDHLATQVAILQSKHPGCRVFKDCASGLNFKRKGLQALLQLAAQGRVRRVHVAYKDRLCRFAYDLLEFVLKQHGAEIVVDADDAHSPEQELADDVLSIITVFGARLYGKRSGGRRRQQASQVDSGASSSDGASAAGSGSEAEEASTLSAEDGD